MHLTLTPHPAMPPAEPAFELWATAELVASFGASATVNLWFGVRAPWHRFRMPVSSEPARRDELWRTTCFEAFLRPRGSDAYQEWNFAPSGDWAAYDFNAYRAGMAPAAVGAPPYIRVEDNLSWWGLGATFAVPSGNEWAVGLSAVLEEEDGAKSYWALAHSGGAPDFHHPDCFVARLA